MLDLAIGFFDKLFTKLFLDAAAGKIRDAFERRHVARQIDRAAEAPAQTLDNYFRNEGLTEEQSTAILDCVQDVIASSGVDASMVAAASLDAEKLTMTLLTRYPAPARVTEEGLEWPYRMALQITADALCNIGPRFAAWERAAWHRTFEGIDKLIANQEQILASVGLAGAGSRDERFAHTYRSHILRRLATIDASTFRASSSLLLDLTTVFVQPDVLERTLVQSVVHDQTLAPGARLSLADARKQMHTYLQAGACNDRIQADAFIAVYPRCVIVGLPGSGKTTLLQHLLLLAANGELSCDPAQRLIPVLVKVRQLDPTQLPGVEELLTIAESRIFAGACPGFLQRRFAAGQILFLIDGLDEAVDEKRATLLQWIGDFVDVYPMARYVVTSRPAGYQPEVFQDMEFHEGTLCEFNIEQIRHYVLRWAKAVAMAEGASPDEADEISQQSAATLVTRTEQNPYVQRIATNPLLLSTLCLVQRYEGGTLPNRRVMLYQRCAEGLLFHWDNKRGLPPAILGTLSLDRKELLLRRLALTMQLQGVAEVDESLVVDTFRTVLQEVGEPAAVHQIIVNIRDRSGLLVERRPGIYGFSHLTFQEYFAASAIHQGDDLTYDRFFLFSKREDPQWAEVIVLYAGLATRQAVEQFLRELQGTGKTNTILLSGSCLAAAQEVPLEVQQAVIRALLAVPNSAADEVLSILDALDARIVTREAITAVHTLSTLHAIEYLTDKTDPSVAAALEAASCKVMIGDADNTTHGLATIASLIHMPTQEALQGIQRLDERARGMGHEDLAEYIGKAIEKQVDEVVQGVPGGRSVGVGWGKGRIADEGLMEVIQEIFLGLIVVPRAMREKHRGKPMATWGYLVTRVVETIEIRRGYIRRVAAGRSPKPKGHAETRVGLASHMQRFSEIAWAEQQRKCKSATEEIRQLVALQRGF